MKKTLFALLFLLSNLLFSQFVELAQSVGIDHVYNEVSNMGGGATFFDYNNDGWEDLYITGGTSKDSFYENNGDGTFSLKDNIGINITGDVNTIAVVAGDVNQDGFKDVFVTTWRVNNSGDYERNFLFINNGDGTFNESSLSYGFSHKVFSMGVNMLDYNKDGLLDIYVINYIENVKILYDGSGQPNGYDHDCFSNLFYENNGDGTFTEKSALLGLDNSGCALASMPTDFDQDNDQDIYIANDFGEFVLPNSLYKNNFPSEIFTDISSMSQTDIAIYAMGIAYGDIDKDADFDYYITNLGRNVLLENDGNGVFSDITTAAGVENTYTLDTGNLLTTSWGTAFLDINNDTWQDLFVANGRVPAFEFIATGEQDPNMMYTNNGDSTFTGEILAANNLNRGRGMAYSDYDKDGDLDILVVVQEGSTNTTPKTVLFQNQLNPQGNDGKNWVQFDLTGTTVNTEAIGTKVKVKVNGETLIQEVHGQGSHASQHSLVLHFGLANNDIIDEVEIIWSENSTQIFTNVEVNTRYSLTEGESLGIENQELASETILYPNPLKDKLFFRKLALDSHISIYTIEGKLVLQEKVSANNTSGLNVDFLNNGAYVVKVKNANKTFSELFIKE